MAKYRLFVHKKRPLAGMKEPGIFEDGTGRLYLRPRLANGQRPYLSLRTKSIGVAIKMRDARRAAKAGARLGIAIEPEKAAKKAKVSVATVIRRYQKDGYPTKKGVARHSGRHLTGEMARCATMLEYFTTDEPAEKSEPKRSRRLQGLAC
jgi:hypothetical protein